MGVRYAAPDGRRREMGLGNATLVDLADAREAALEARKQAKDRHRSDRRAR